MLRNVMGVITGYAVWTAIWLAGNKLFFGAAAEAAQGGRYYSEAGPLIGVLALSIACSLAAGLATVRVALGKARGALLVMAGLLLVTGIAVQAGVWHLMPVWYHLIFLGLLIPVSLAGGRLAPRTSEG
jgi:energy-converting hydrogenase Eha subunit F